MKDAPCSVRALDRVGSAFIREWPGTETALKNAPSPSGFIEGGPCHALLLTFRQHHICLYVAQCLLVTSPDGDGYTLYSICASNHLIGAIMPSVDLRKRKACQNCTKAKAKCSPSENGLDICYRCQRLKKECIFEAATKQRAPKSRS